MVDQKSATTTNEQPERKDGREPRPQTSRLDLLLLLNSNWDKFTETEKDILYGLIGRPPVANDNRLAAIVHAISENGASYVNYTITIPELISRHVDSPTSVLPTNSGKKTSPVAVWILAFLPLITMFIQFLLRNRSNPVEKNVTNDLKRKRLERKIEKKRAKAHRVQKYINRMRAESSDEDSEVDGTIKLNNPIECYDLPSTKKRLVKGTPEYEEEKRRLDAEMDEYAAERDRQSRIRDLSYM